MSTYRFDLKAYHEPIIKVIGVGGGGSNAVNNMYNHGIKDVAFVVCNTDAQALQNSPIQHKLQIGANLTGGLGAGANPEVGKNAAIESKDAIKELLGHHTKMLFITAGMGGGTGTGAAPVIASIAKKLDILTVGIVTLPFSFEGKRKLLQAQEGIKQLKQYCDTVLIILNDRLQAILGNLSIGNAFLQADNVLTTAAKSIAEIITVPGYVNVDFEDVKTVMRDAGAAVMGSGQAEGESRARKAAEIALSSPLLDYKDIHGAKKILLSIVSGQEAELQMDELTIITDYIQEQMGRDAEMIFGHGSDPQLAESVRVTVIATGFGKEKEQVTLAYKEHKKTKLTGVHSPSLFEALDSETYTPPFPCSQGGNYVKETLSPIAVEEAHGAHASSLSTNELAQRKQLLYQEAQERVKKLSSKKEIKWSEKSIQEQLEVPAYLRRGVQLQPIAQLSEQHITRQHLYDEKEPAGAQK